MGLEVRVGFIRDRRHDRTPVLPGVPQEAYPSRRFLDSHKLSRDAQITYSLSQYIDNGAERERTLNLVRYAADGETHAEQLETARYHLLTALWPLMHEYIRHNGFHQARLERFGELCCELGIEVPDEAKPWVEHLRSVPGKYLC